MIYKFVLYWVLGMILLCSYSNSFTSCIQHNGLSPSINSSFNYVGVVPYFRNNGDLYIALYKCSDGTEYADVGDTRRPGEKYIAQTAARIFFPLQQHRSLRTGSIDWHSQGYLAKMVFKGPWPRGYLMEMGNNHYTYILEIQRPSYLKKLLAHPLIIVKMRDLLDAIAPARAADNFRDIAVIDFDNNSFAIQEHFAHSLARADNWNFLQELIATK